jgi:hypothetical protein
MTKELFVKCIDASGAYDFLTEGKVYKVVDALKYPDCYMLDANTNYWNKGRFEIIKENT